jgi:hypothetical protein
MTDEADEWETPPMKTGIIPLPPLPDPQLPPGSWATDGIGGTWLNCNNVWVPKASDMVTSRYGRVCSRQLSAGLVSPLPPRLTFCCPQCLHEFEIVLKLVDARPTLTAEPIGVHS